jgi:hypothetical protein
MKTPQTLARVTLVLALAILNARLSAALAQGTAFTYRGRLNDGGSPANGIYDLRFTIYDSLSGGAIVSGPLTNAATGVTNGAFTVALDFGSGPFRGGAARWLNIDVQTNGGGSFATLSPRQAITATPYSITAGNLTGALPASQLSGTILLAQLPGAVLTNNETGVTFNGALTLNGTLNLPTTTSSAGAIYLNGNRFLHAYGSDNFFAGQGAGNSSMTGSLNVGVGDFALAANTSGTLNSALGSEALLNNTGGSFNTAIGGFALEENMSGSGNTAVGYEALENNTAGDNTAMGYGALGRNTIGNDNAAFGVLSLAYNTNGTDNTAIGANALYSNTSGARNTAEGGASLFYNTIGADNTASGYEALYSNTTGSGNTADGGSALFSNTNGNYNTANGDQALQRNTSGSENTANGFAALNSSTSGNLNTAVGFEALTANTNGSGNIAVGNNAGATLTSGDSNIDIGNQGADGDNATIRIGTPGTQTNTLIAGIYGASAPGGLLVAVNASGQLGTTTTLPGGQLSAPLSIAGTNVMAAPNTSYVATNASLTTINLPTTANVGDVVQVEGAGAGGWQVNGTNIYGHVTQGILWTAQAGAPSTYWRCVASSADGTHLVAVEDGGQLYASTDSGTNWTATSAPSTGWSSVASSAGGTHLVAAVYNGQVYTSANSGTNWTAQAGPPSAEWVAVASSADGTHLVAVPGYGQVFTTDSTVVTTITPVNGSPSSSAQFQYIGNGVWQVIGTWSANGTNLYYNGGNIGIGTATPAHLLVVGGSVSPAYCDGSTWANGSDRNSKEAFAAISPRAVLEKVSALPITEWKYKVEADGTRHLGPVAQDFHAAFGLNGADDKHIATVDEEGVALAAIQGLNQKLEQDARERDAEIGALGPVLE